MLSRCQHPEIRHEALTVARAFAVRAQTSEGVVARVHHHCAGVKPNKVQKWKPCCCVDLIPADMHTKHTTAQAKSLNVKREKKYKSNNSRSVVIV